MSRESHHLQDEKEESVHFMPSLIPQSQQISFKYFPQTPPQGSKSTHIPNSLTFLRERLQRMARNIKRLRQVILLKQLQQSSHVLLAGLETTRDIADGVFAAIGTDPAGDAVHVDAVADLDFLWHFCF
jgi:hypothetical protein